jgi:hypothetical protein
MHRSWIEFSKKQIAHEEEMLKGEKEHLAKCEEWLADAIADQKAFEALEA